MQSWLSGPGGSGSASCVALRHIGQRSLLKRRHSARHALWNWWPHGSSVTARSSPIISSRQTAHTGGGSGFSGSASAAAAFRAAELSEVDAPKDERTSRAGAERGSASACPAS